MKRFYPKPGEHIYYYLANGIYSHHGIYCGNILDKQNIVIHFDKGQQITSISYEEFSKGREIHVRQYPKGTCDNPGVVVYRAMNKLNKAGYNLFNNNCEHFVHWCKTGKKSSKQINNVAGPAAGLVEGVAGGAVGLVEGVAGMLFGKG